MSRRFAFILILVIAAVFINNFDVFGGIKAEGNKYIIDVDMHHVVALGGPRLEESFVLIGFSPKVPGGFTTFLGGIPISKAREFSTKYGDFLGCESSGAHNAQQAVSDIQFFAFGPSIESTIQKINKLFNEKNYRPVVKIRAVKLNVIEHKYLGMKYVYHGDLYLATDLSIIQENYK